MSKKLAVFGATGPTGQELVKQALAAGHQVTAVVRTPEKLTEELKNNANLKCVKGDVFSSDSLLASMGGVEVVLSCLGAHGIGVKLPFQQPMTFYEDSCKSIIEAMKKNNMRRFVTMTSWCTKKEPGNPGVVEWIIRPLMIARHLDSMARMEDFLQSESSNIDFTVVRPPGLGKGPSEGKEIVAAEGQFLSEGVSLYQEIPRADVAKFMLQCIDTEQWNGKCVAIHVKKD